MKSLSLIVCLILTVGYLTSVQAVSDAELEALEKQIEQLEEEKKRAEGEQKKKAEVEKKRLSKLEKQRMEEQKRFEEEKNKLEEDKRKLEEAKLVELERQRQEEEAKQLALEEQQRKEEEKEEPFQDFFDEFFNDTKEPIREDVKLNNKAGSSSTKTAWIGVYIQDVPQDLVNQFGLSEDQGVLIAEIAANSPAKAAGLIQRDIILKFDKHEIHKLADLPSLVKSRNAGDIVPVEYLRNGKKLTTNVTLGELNIK